MQWDEKWKHHDVRVWKGREDTRLVENVGSFGMCPKDLKEQMMMRRLDEMMMKSVQQSLEAWPYRRECRGHNPAKKESVRTGAACSVGKACTCTRIK